MAAAAGKIFQLKVTLREVSPPVWRRLLVPSAVTLPELHRILQIAMGWHDSHLHSFRFGPAQYLDPDPDSGLPLAGERDERGVRLDALLQWPRQKLVYEYDFGDGWQHTVLLEKVIDRDPAAVYPACIAAERACPPEDCGGPYGYMDLLEILADRKHERHRELSEWVGEGFDPAVCDIASINALLAPMPKRRRQLRATQGGRRR